MDAHNYPGRGLSLSQLVFALNEELKRVAPSPLITLEAFSQLDRDASNALATIREWTLGARGGVPVQNVASSLQGNGRCTWQKPTQYIANTF
ncbi:hypothetical protein BJ322DRAFT_1109745 [Thelephora terrestris]|uniref:Uncharacterized protein n=1 Tax=Thelephora terrestris TaxID=56493 RepID=A0A9P6L591_9AGAM|nr:hypothetical protein BJ322DRAFT_1109745 [Thelephora terrestris]